MFLRRFFWLLILFTIVGCDRTTETIPNKLTIGVVSYEQSDRSLEKYSELKNYLAIELKSLIEVEPAYNEIKALEQISRKKWDLVFAPPGLAAIAISQYNYLAILPLEGVNKTRSVIVVKEDSDIEKIQDLAGQVIALGQKGSATGYYLPLYNLYGLKLAEVRFAPTPQTSLKWLNNEEVVAVALSLEDFNLYRRKFNNGKFKIIYRDYHEIPPGSILVGDRVNYSLQARIENKLTETPSFIAASAGFIPTEKVPKYNYLIKVIKRVQPITKRIKEKPAILYETNPTSTEAK